MKMSKDGTEEAGRQETKTVRKAPDDKQTSAQGLYEQAADGVQGALGHAKDALASGAASVAKAVKGAADEKTNPDLRALREDLAKLTRTIGELVEQQSETRRAQVLDALSAAGENVSGSAAAAQEKIESIEGDIESRIQRNPWSAIAIALGVGILIGKMT
jgi:ElaB/YqjD/DUF883 family membrane-anchored ribosome-binding protein